ncbi:MAG: hypothetical protein PHI41_10330 [Erysipelotrichaceae bacterium]|nr:hypothetical protein [Erysipelotrichaceae bacterium]
MSVMDVCFSVLILSGAFAIMALGLVFLRSSALIQSLNNIVATLPETIDRVNKILDDIDYKLDLLNAPLETINRLFNRSAVRHSDIVAKTAANIIKSRKKQKK